MLEEESRALHAAYEAYPTSWRRRRRFPDIDVWAASVTLDWLAALKPGSVDILDIGCGAVWLTDALALYGPVTGVETAQLGHPALVRALARGEYAQDPTLLPRYLTTGAPSAKSCDRFSIALALGEPTLPSDFVQFCRNVADVVSAGGWFAWNPIHYNFNEANDWRSFLGAEFSVLDVVHLTTPFDPKAMHRSEAIIMLARRNGG